MNTDVLPIVSVACITYNHEPYIRQCLDGFVMQKTNFPFEIVIHDDASTDNTKVIIQEYCQKYPHLFRPIFQDINRFKEGKGILARFVFPECRGKYIALCEGDDYWTDPLKLQKQVDFLEVHQDYVMTSHKCSVYNETLKQYVSENSAEEDVPYSMKDLLGGKWYYQTLSILFRADALNNMQLYKYRMSSDTVLVYELLQNGKGIQFKDVMGCYRYHDKGIWSLLNMNAQRDQEFKIRLHIYDVNQNVESAKLLLSLWQKPISRLWLLKNIKYTLASEQIFRRHFGCYFTIRLFFRKFVCNQAFSNIQN